MIDTYLQAGKYFVEGSVESATYRARYFFNFDSNQNTEKSFDSSAGIVSTLSVTSIFLLKNLATPTRLDSLRLSIFLNIYLDMFKNHKFCASQKFVPSAGIEPAITA